MFKRSLLIAVTLLLIGCGSEDETVQIPSIEEQEDGSYVVNLNAKANGEDNPVSLALEAGDYKITPISSHYTSWMAWSSIKDCYTEEKCIHGWSNKYQYDISDDPNIIGDVMAIRHRSWLFPMPKDRPLSSVRRPM